MARAFRLLRVIVIVVVVLVLLPYLIAPFYRFVDPVSTTMLWRWMQGPARGAHRSCRSIGIAPSLPRAVISAEDGSFCTHHGIDWRGCARRSTRPTTSREMRGGSTITQQVANLFLWQGRSYVRKALEMPLAIWIDLVLPKRRVLEIYLNVAEWGPNGQFGAEAGARYAFNKSARQVSPARRR